MTCREVLYEEGADGVTRVTGVCASRAGKEEIIKADAYIAALDVPGAQRLIPEVGSNSTPLAAMQRIRVWKGLLIL